MKNHLKRQMPVLPTPKSWRWTDYTFHCETVGQIYADELYLKQAEFLRKEFFSKKIEINLYKNDPPERHAVYLLLPDQMKDVLKKHKQSFGPFMDKEGYIIIVEADSVYLFTRTPRGLFYAIKTLMWLAGGKDQIPGCVIRDWPDFGLRGISDDISRGQVSTMENFKKIIRFLADLKMNVYMPYLEDMYRFDCYPNIGGDRGALTKKECLALQDYADDHHVEIIPIFQTLGHYENILLQPEFRHLADFAGAGSLNVTDEAVYTFLKNVLDEICPIFRSIYFHIGADESWDVGMGASREAANRHGVASVHAKHYRRVIDMVKKYGKKVMMYGDIILDHPAILNEIPRDTVIVDWHYDIRPFYASTEFFQKSACQYLVSPGIHSWSRIFPNISAACANISAMIQSGLNNGAMGVILSNWGDFGGANFRELSYFPFAFGADKSWNYNGSQLEEFETKFFNYFYGTDDPGLSHIYHVLGKAAQGFKTDHFFGFPFYRPAHLAELTLRQAELPLLAKGVLRETEKLQTLKKNHTHLDIFRLCAEMFLWFGRLSNVQLELFQNEQFDLNDPTVIEKKLEQLSSDLQEIKKKYEKIWLDSNRPENLHRILSLMDRMVRCLSLKREHILSSPEIADGPPAFISHPLALNQPVSRVFLRKKFIVEKPGKAWLQVIAESHAKIWINGEQLAEMYARRSLSAIVEAERVKVWDITDMLKRGDNCLAISVKNYDPQAIAAANVWLEPANDKVICSDTYWKVCDDDTCGWNSLSFDDSYWLSTVEIASKWIFNRPRLGKGLPSRIEFYKERFL